MSIYQGTSRNLNCSTCQYIKERPAIQFAKKFFSDNDLQDTIANKINIDCLKVKSEIIKFIHYWTELNKSGTKERWELQKTFDVKRRLCVWLNNINKFDKTSHKIYDFTTK